MIHKSLLDQLEYCILAMEEKGESHDDIFSYVHMILRGFIRNGALTPEYVQLARQAQEFKEAMAREEAMRNSSPIVNVNGENFTADEQKRQALEQAIARRVTKVTNS